jgi:hypothetical protein
MFKELAADGYIFVTRSERSLSGSEGEYDLAASIVVSAERGTIATRDTYDTIDWLVRLRSIAPLLASPLKRVSALGEDFRPRKASKSAEGTEL